MVLRDARGTVRVVGGQRDVARTASTSTPVSPMVNLPVFLPAADRATFKTKVIYNCLLREDLQTHAPPIRSTFSDDWPAEIQARVLERWSEYGYRP